jgi:peptide/nickel transport system substrate-binding protein/oligopeptide transport system substrate-binding protein
MAGSSLARKDRSRAPRQMIAALIAALMAAALAGCGSDRNGGLDVVAIGEPKSPFATGARLGPTGQTVRQATVEGLVGFDEEGRVVPALADRWIITDDGLSYIFRLRDGTWPDGSAITGQGARTSLLGAIAALSGTPFARDLSDIGEVRAMAGRVIEIRLERPVPNLLQMLAQPELGLPWKGKGSGPMALKRDGYVALLTPIAPQQRGLPAIRDWKERTREIRLVSLRADQAVRRFNEGESDVLLGGRIEHFPLASALGLSRGTIRLDPVTGLFGLLAVHETGFLARPENREALAMAIDREALIAPFGLGGWTPATRIVAAGVEGDPGLVSERWTTLSPAERKAQARARVERWRAGGEAEPRLRVALPAGPGSDLLFARLRSDFAEIGIRLDRTANEGSADLRLIDLVARYPRADWFLNQLSCQSRRAPCSPLADERMAAARASRDAAERTALLAEAEDELTRANVFIPFGQPVRWSLVRGHVTGFATNPWNIHPLMPMALRTR